MSSLNLVALLKRELTGNLKPLEIIWAGANTHISKYLQGVTPTLINNPLVKNKTKRNRFQTFHFREKNSTPAKKLSVLIKLADWLAELYYTYPYPDGYLTEHFTVLELKILWRKGRSTDFEDLKLWDVQSDIANPGLNRAVEYI